MESKVAASASNKDEKKFQHYKSSRQAMKMISKTGRKIIFVNYQYMTCEKDIIEYLNEEIELGLNVITKGELLTSEEADPMAALKRKHIAEYLAKKAEELKNVALGVSKDMGSTKSKEALASGAKPLSTTGVTTKAGA